MCQNERMLKSQADTATSTDLAENDDPKAFDDNMEVICFINLQKWSHFKNQL